MTLGDRLTRAVVVWGITFSWSVIALIVYGTVLQAHLTEDWARYGAILVMVVTYIAGQYVLRRNLSEVLSRMVIRDDGG